MARITGISDTCQVFDSVPADITQTLGHIVGARYDLDNQVRQEGSCGGGADFVENIHNVMRNTFGFTIHPTDLGTCLAEFDPFGSVSDVCPEISAKLNIHGTGGSMKHIHLTGGKMGTMVIRLAKDEPVEVSVDGFAKDYSIVTSEISNTPPASAREYYLDGYVTMGGVAVGSCENFTITVERNLDPRRGCEQVSAGSRRVASEIVEGMRNITWDGVVEITDENMFKHITGDSSAPLDPADAPSDITITLVLDSTTVTLTGCAVSPLGMDRSTGGDVRTLSIRGVALGGSIA